MVIKEKWGVPYEQIYSFFQEQADVFVHKNGFRYQDCYITFSAFEEKVFGKWNMPHTKIQFEGSEKSVKTIYRRFFLRFLSAGG